MVVARTDWPRPWREKALRLALHLGVASPDKPLFPALAGSLSPFDHIRLAADLGFAGITDNGMKLRPAPEQSKIGEALARRGLVMGSFTNSPMGTKGSFWGDPDPSLRDAFLQSVRESIEVGRRTGGREITTCALKAENIDFNQQIETFGARVREAADMAAAGGMVLAIEPTSATRTPFFLVHHIADALRVIGPAAHPGLSLMFDTGHVHEMDGDPVDAFKRCRTSVQTVQIADAAGRLEPGAGRTDFKAFFSALKQDGFAGLIELEHYLSRDGMAGEEAALSGLSEIVNAI